MSFKHLMVIKAAVCLAFGILLLAIPDRLLSLFGSNIERWRNVYSKGVWSCLIW